MASERERWVGHLDLFLHTKNRPANAHPLPDALRFLVKGDVAGSAKAVVSDPRWTIQLADLKVNQADGYATLLFLGLDAQRAAAVYGNIKTLNLRTAIKEPDEAGAISAHLVVSLQAHKKTQGYHAVLEEVEGLSRSKIVPILRKIIDDNVSFFEQGPDGKPVAVETSLASDIVHDKPIRDQLNEARLLSVDVMKRSRKRSIDTKEEYQEKVRLIHFKPSSESFGAKAKRIVTNILARRDVEEYPDVRIRIEEPTGRERTVSVDRTKQDALTGAFQRRTLIEDLDPALPEATKSIIAHLAHHMAKALE